MKVNHLYLVCAVFISMIFLSPDKLQAAPYNADITAPSIPTALTVTSISTDTISLSWSASTDAVGVTGYKIYRNGTLLYLNATLTKIDSGLNNATSYCYQVSAYDAASNESAKSVEACAATSAIVNWQKSSGPEGGAASFAFDPNNHNVIYSAAGANGPFKSINGGASWFLANNGKVGKDTNNIIVDSVDGNIVYAAGMGGVYKSTNAGNTWGSLSNGLPSPSSVTRVIIDPTNHQTIYAVGFQNNGVYKSLNGGSTWNSASSGITGAIVAGLATSPNSPQVLYAAGSGGIFKSSNGGATWSAVLNVNSWYVNIDPTNDRVIYVLATFGSGTGYFKSTDAGSSWVNVNTAPIDSSVGYLLRDPIQSQTMYVRRGEGAVYKSVNGGASWTIAFGGRTDIWKLAIDPTDSQTFYISTTRDLYGGIMKSTDGGITWTDANSGFVHTYVWSIAVDPNDINIVFAGTNKVFKSNNGSTSWTLSSNGVDVNTSVMSTLQCRII